MFSSAFVCLLAALREIYSRDNTCGEITCFQGVSYVPSHGLGPSVPPNFWDVLHDAHTVWETATKFCVVIKADVKQFLHRRPRVLMRDLFAVANLLVLQRMLRRTFVIN